MSNKYGAIPTRVDGRLFASQAEARRYQELKLLQAAGEIDRLECQPRWRLVVNGLEVGSYIADFVYWTPDGKRVVEDVKGGRATMTPDYLLKKKLMLALYGIEIVEVQA